MCGSHCLVDPLLEVGVGVFLLQVGNVVLALVDGALVRVTLDVRRRAVLLPVVQLEPLLHLIILLLLPEQRVRRLDTSNHADRQAQVCSQ